MLREKNVARNAARGVLQLIHCTIYVGRCRTVHRITPLAETLVDPLTGGARPRQSGCRHSWRCEAE